MTDALIEHRFTCPYCWESISMLIDPSIGRQSYVEDCEVCCNPITLHVRVENDEVVEFETQQTD